MNAQAKLRMDADEFITWAVNLPNGKRYELVAGEVVPMAAERAGHVRIKYRAWQAFSARSRSPAWNSTCWVTVWRSGSTP